MASAGDIRAGGAFVEIFAKDGKFQQAMTRVSNRLRETGKNLQQFGTGLSLGAGAVGAPMALAVRQFASLDDAVRAAAAAAGKGEGDLAGMRDAAEQMGIKFGMAATDVAKLGVEIARAFGDKLSTDQINSVTEAVIALAKASGTEGPIAAKIMTSTLSQFGMSAEQASRVSDVLTHAANATLNSVEGLGEALSYAGVAAADMGMSFEDTVAILGTLGNVGIEASMAGTALRRLATVSGAEAAKLQQIFGVAFVDAAGNVRPLVDVLGEVNEATKNLPTGERTKKFSDAFGLLGITGAKAIGKMSVDTKKLADDLRNASGTAVKQAQFMEAGIGGAGRKLLVSIQAIGNAFGEAIAPAVTFVANAFGVLARGMQAVLKQFPILSQLAAGTVAAVFAVGVAAIVSGFAMKTAAGGITAFGKALAVIATPAVLSTLAIVGAITALTVAAYQISPAFRKEARGVMAALASMDFKTAWEILNTNVAIALVRMGAMFSDSWASVKNTAAATATYIGDTLAEGVDRLFSLFGADILTLQGSLEKLGLYFKSAFDFSWATGKLQRAIKDVDDRIAKAREEAPTADARAAQRRQRRVEDAAERSQADAERRAGFGRVVDELQADLDRLHDRLKPKPVAEETKPVERPVARQVGSAAPQAATAAADQESKTTSGTISTMSTGLGARIGVGPSLTSAQKTAAATSRTADATESMAEQMGTLDQRIGDAVENGLANLNGLGNASGVANEVGVGNEHGAAAPPMPAVPPPAAAAPAPTTLPPPSPGGVGQAAAAAQPAAPGPMIPVGFEAAMAAGAKIAVGSGMAEALAGLDTMASPPPQLSELEQLMAEAEARNRGEPPPPKLDGAAASQPVIPPPAAAILPPVSPDMATRVGAAAMPSADRASSGVDRELLSVAERQANLQQQAVQLLGQILRAANGGSLSFA